MEEENKSYNPLQEKDLLEGKAKLFTSEVRDSQRAPHKVEYVHIPITEDPNLPKMLDIPWVKDHLQDILDITRERFPTYTDDYLNEKFTQYINNANGLDIITASDGHIEGYHFYKLRNLQGYNPTLKSMYTHYAAIREADEGKNLNEITRIPALDVENPDVIAGSTANPAIYISNQRIAQRRGMAFYPTDLNVPDALLRLGQQVLDATQTAANPPSIEAGLKRTYASSVSRGKGPAYPFFEEVMKLEPNQHVLYMMVRPSIHSRIIEQQAA
ncbi:MAG: hypothetical protein H0W89_04665 [Candidatus Levybacteria bacterium]|nr:hypothetical protein [Candidatus Levybacteria bacterium]